MTTRNPISDLDVGELYRRYYPMVARRVRQFVPRDEVESLTHDVFLRALENAADFREESAPVTWLYRMTTNHCLNWVRDRRARTRLLEVFGPTSFAERHAPDPDTVAFVHELWRELDPELAAIGIYFYLDGLTQADIARTIGCSERTVASRVKELQSAIRKREDRR